MKFTPTDGKFHPRPGINMIEKELENVYEETMREGSTGKGKK